MSAVHEIILGNRTVRICNSNYTGYKLELYIDGVYKNKAYTGFDLSVTRKIAEALVKV